MKNRQSEMWRRSRRTGVAPDRRVARLVGFALSAFVAASVLIVTQAQTPSRGAGATAAPRSVIAGVVRAPDGRDAAPGATVALRNVDNGATTQAVTDVNGRFVFKDLPAGRFLLHTTKPGYVGTNYGADRRGKPALVLAVADGQTMQGLDVQLVRGAALSGRIVDETGAPVAGAEVRAIERVASDVGVRWSRAGVVSSDDRGMYRLFGLGEGDYVIAAVRPDLGAGPAPPRLPSAAPPHSSGSSANSPPEAAPSKHAARFSPVFYPGTADPTAPPVVSVQSGTDQADMNFTFHLVQTAEIQGRLAAPPGVSMRGVRVTLTAAADSVLLAVGDPRVRFANVSADGNFSFVGISPGTYSVFASTVTPAAAGGGSTVPAGPLSRGRYAVATAVVLNGERFVGLDTMRLATGALVSGRLTFDGTQAAPLAGRIAIHLNRLADGQAVFDLPPARPDSEGTFAFTGVPPGHYTIGAALLAGSSEERVWHVERAVVGGRYVLDASIQVQPGDDVTDVNVVMTSRVTELTGMLFDPAGRPSYNYYLIAFPVNAQLWKPGSRWLRAPGRPASDGTFKIVGLPAGEYYLAAVTDYDPHGWWTPSFLQQLAPAAIRVTLVDGQSHKQNLRVGAGG